jgi:hypothetical protein
MDILALLTDKSLNQIYADYTIVCNAVSTAAGFVGWRLYKRITKQPQEVDHGNLRRPVGAQTQTQDTAGH